MESTIPGDMKRIGAAVESPVPEEASSMKRRWNLLKYFIMLNCDYQKVKYCDMIGIPRSV